MQQNKVFTSRKTSKYNGQNLTILPLKAFKGKNYPRKTET